MFTLFIWNVFCQTFKRLTFSRYWRISQILPTGRSCSRSLEGNFPISLPQFPHSHMTIWNDICLLVYNVSKSLKCKLHEILDSFNLFSIVISASDWKGSKLRTSFLWLLLYQYPTFYSSLNLCYEAQSKWHHLLIPGLTKHFLYKHACLELPIMLNSQVFGMYLIHFIFHHFQYLPCYCVNQIKHVPKYLA